MSQQRTALIALLLAVSCGHEEEAPPVQPAPVNASTAPAPAPVEPAAGSQQLRDPEPSLTEVFIQPAEPGRPPASEHIENSDGTFTVREYHPNGWLYTERIEKVGPDGKRVRHGPLAAWFENRQLMFRGAYSDGKKTGHWTYWMDTGVREREGDQEEDRRSGDWLEWHPNGQLKSKGLFHANMAEGPWKFWHENGALQAEGEFVNNKREGPWKFYLADGQPDPSLSGEYRAHQRVR